MAEPVIQLEQVSRVYKLETQQVQALREVSLVVNQGQCVAIVGRSGSGKSTLLHLVGTLDRPSQGRVLLRGVEVSSLNDTKLSQFRNSSVGFVFQTHNLLPEFTALENVMMPGLIAGIDQKKVRARAEELLSTVGLAERLRHRPAELSGGEQQRVAIARALLMQPAVLLADEPTGNLDQRTAEGVEELLLGLCTRHNITMLLVTHDEKLARKLPFRMVMEDGLIIDRGGLG